MDFPCGQLSFSQALRICKMLRQNQVLYFCFRSHISSNFYSLFGRLQPARVGGLPLLTRYRGRTILFAVLCWLDPVRLGLLGVVLPRFSSMLRTKIPPDAIQL